MSRNLSPALLSRLDRLAGCQGRWIVDCRQIEGDYSYALRSLSEPWPHSQADGLGRVERYWHSTPDGSDRNPYRFGSLRDAALYCAHTGWKSRLLFVSDYLREDCSWPGGYSPSAVYRSNARVFRDEFKQELELADADGPDVSLDVRYVTDDMIDTLESLEQYPLLSDDDHTELEMEDQREAWECWAAREWRRLVCAALDAALPENAPQDGDDILDSVEDVGNRLLELFHDCAERSNTYWQEEQGTQWIDLERVAAALVRQDLRDLAGLALPEPPEPVLVLSDSHGRHIPQLWCSDLAKGDCADLGISWEDVRCCQCGPDEDWYWEAWQAILNSCQMTDDRGTVWRLHQDGDLWEVADGYRFPEA